MSTEGARAGSGRAAETKAAGSWAAKYREMTMPEKRKRKRDLISTFQHIERYHQRRAIFTMHITLSLAFQLTMWVNWFVSYAVRGVGFTNNFFSDRFMVSLVLLIVLGGHFALMRLMEDKDRLVIEALRQHENDLDSYEDEETDGVNEDATQFEYDEPIAMTRRSSVQ
jgi:hypothetical protein